MLLTRLGLEGAVYYYIKFRTFSYTSFNWIHEAFYVNGVKIVPLFIAEYLTPLALAIWIIDDGAAVSSGMKLCTNSFTLLEVQFLCNVLHDKYGLIATVNGRGRPNQYNVYISKYSMPLLASIVREHMHPSMYYKLNGHLPLKKS